MTLELLPFDRHWAHEVAAGGHASLAEACSNWDAVSPYLEPAIQAHIALYERTGAVTPWIAYLARLSPSREFTGLCSFKDNCRDGRVEIAYHTFAPYEGHGHARSMAAQLTDLAFRHPDVREVTARTLAAESASTRILGGLGFRRAGAQDEAASETWQWRLRRTDRTSTFPFSRILNSRALKDLF